MSPEIFDPVNIGKDSILRVSRLSVYFLPLFGICLCEIEPLGGDNAV